MVRKWILWGLSNTVAWMSNNKALSLRTQLRTTRSSSPPPLKSINSNYENIQCPSRHSPVATEIKYKGIERRMDASLMFELTGPSYRKSGVSSFLWNARVLIFIFKTRVQSTKCLSEGRVFLGQWSLLSSLATPGVIKCYKWNALASNCCI